MDLKTYLSSLDVPRRDEVAAACGTTRGHLQNISYGLRTCSAELATALERESKGAVTRRDLRPDDWQAIWPELVASPEPKAEA